MCFKDIKKDKKIDWKIDRVCPFTVPNKCTKFDKYLRDGFLSFLPQAEVDAHIHTYTNKTNDVSPSQQVAKGIISPHFKVTLNENDVF